MITANSLRKIPFIFFIVFLTVGMFNPCFSQTTNYEAANWKTWLLDNPQEIQMAPPDFESEMKDLKNLKQTFKTASLAYFWANNGGFDFWSDMAGQKMFEYRIMDDAPAVARIYTVLHTAYHDAAIAIFDAKYVVETWMKK